MLINICPPMYRTHICCLVIMFNIIIIIVEIHILWRYLTWDCEESHKRAVYNIFGYLIFISKLFYYHQQWWGYQGLYPNS